MGRHLGVTAEDDTAATHHFEATLPGYRGWQWAVVVAAPPEATYATVSESALLPGPDALIAPDFLPWEQRIRPGDLSPGDLLAPPRNDPRLVPGYVATGDPAVDDVALRLGLGRPQVLSREGRLEAADRWYAEFGPDTEMARSAPATCGVCGFFTPLAGSLSAAFGVCANAMGADGRVVSLEYGCGAHSDVELPTGGGSPAYEAYDDAAFDIIPTAEFRPRVESPAAEQASEATETVVVEERASQPDSELGSTADSASAAVDSVTGDPEPEAAVADSAVADSAAPAADADAAPITLFDVTDPDAAYDDAWAVSSVRVESEAAPDEPGAPEHN